jgi:hypothetical protein
MRRFGPLILTIAAASCARYGFSEHEPTGELGAVDVHLSDRGDPSAPLDTDGDKVPDALDPRPAVFDKVHYFGYPGARIGDFYAPGPGAWQSSGDELCKYTDSDNESIAVLKPGLIPVTDYTVEATASVLGTGPVSGGDWPDVGLALRVTTTGRSTDGHLYQCLIDLKNRSLVVGGLYKGNWNEWDRTGKQTVPAAGPYRIRATMKGSQLTCQLVPGPSISHTDTKLTDGTCGYTTDYASVCFASLLVTDPI